MDTQQLHDLVIRLEALGRKPSEIYRKLVLHHDVEPHVALAMIHEITHWNVNNKRISLRSYRRVHPPNRSLSHIGNQYRKGKPTSEATKQKISAKLKGQKRSLISREHIIEGQKKRRMREAAEGKRKPYPVRWEPM